MIIFIFLLILSGSVRAECVEDTPYSFSTSGFSETIGRWLFSGEGIIWNFPRDKKEVFLTFDDAPSLKYTPSILDVLNKHKVKGSFFIIGNRLKSEKEKTILRRIAEDGHDIFPHSRDHKNSLLWQDPYDLLKEISEIELEITAITGKTYPKLYRPAWGIIPEAHRKLLLQNGYKIILADVFGGYFSFSRFGFDEPKSKMIPYLLEETQPGSIIVLHNGEKRSDSVFDSECLKEILEVYLPKIKQKFSLKSLGQKQN